MRYVYSKAHTFMCIGGGKTLQVGISDYAQQKAGRIRSITLPYAGETIEKGEPFAEIDAVGGRIEVLAPADAIITKVNLELDGRPELLNRDTKKNWICEVELRGPMPLELLSEERYLKFVQTL